jgi:hypothetical protein
VTKAVPDEAFVSSWPLFESSSDTKGGNISMIDKFVLLSKWSSIDQVDRMAIDYCDSAIFDN